MSCWFGVNLISVWPSICSHKKSYHHGFPQVVIRWNCNQDTSRTHATNVALYCVEQHDVKFNTLFNWKTWLHVFGESRLEKLQTVKVNVFDCIGRWWRESSFLQDSTEELPDIDLISYFRSSQRQHAYCMTSQQRNNQEYDSEDEYHSQMNLDGYNISLRVVRSVLS